MTTPSYAPYYAAYFKDEDTGTGGYYVFDERAGGAQVAGPFETWSAAVADAYDRNERI
jgi:hypothetical protein